MDEVLQNNDELDLTDMLPDEVLHYIFRLFDIVKLLPYASVCKRWYALLKDVRLWKRFDFNELTFRTTRRRITDDIKNGLCSTQLPANLITDLVLNAPVLQYLRAVGFDFSGESSSVISDLVDNCPFLRALYLKRCRLGSRETWNKVAASQWSLRDLSIDDCDVTDEDLKLMLAAHNHLAMLSLSFGETSSITAEALEGVRYLTELRCFLLSNGDLQDACMLQVLNSIGVNLVQVCLVSPSVVILKSLPKCKRLKVLDLRNLEDSVHKIAVIHLKTMINLTHLSFQCDMPMSTPLLIELFSGLCNLECLMLFGPVDDSVVHCITQKCGQRLRFLFIRGGDLSEIANSCTEMEGLLLDFSDKEKMQCLEDLNSKMHKLRWIAIFADEIETQVEVDLKQYLPKAKHIFLPSETMYNPEFLEICEYYHFFKDVDFDIEMTK